MAESNRDWLAQKALEECSVQFRTVWDIFIKWYTVFLTVNILGLGITGEKLTGKSRRFVALVFVVQNLLSFFTAVRIAKFSSAIKVQAREIARWLDASDDTPVRNPLPDAVIDFPIPDNLGQWSGWAVAVLHAFFVVCWAAIWFLKENVATVAGGGL